MIESDFAYIEQINVLLQALPQKLWDMHPEI